MKKFISYLLLAGMLATTGLQSCTNMTPQQKKTKKLKRQQRFGSTPCPCDK